MDRPKLVVIDLDGTVVGHSSAHTRPSAATITALKAVRAAGVPVAVATGRALWSTLRTMDDLQLTDGLHVVSHGAVVYDLAARATAHRILMDPAAAISAYRAADPEVTFAVEYGADGWVTTTDFPRDFESVWLHTLSLDELAAMPTSRLVARVPSQNPYGAGPRCPRAQAATDGARLDVSIYHAEVGFNGWVDVGPAHTTKASGLDLVAAHYGVTAAETIVFGDSANDLPMFAWAGHAVAMGQAAPSIKDAAHEVTSTVDDDGVARVLARWF
ncbi:putative hydrolase [Actinorhabdospora filicis]|uniref:Hydrolase n=1 Tax=Actinorhabdospora filicis TaxID=1785913 RepID=A0A9W6SS19_9ACTN|nr:HAD family hydrolase [Actinorhabdospora filicis]GLZ81303.1 putative hydrolase [Actinorhabdospora filicis]